MNIVILDLEWNAAYSRKLKGYINEIIEFGAVKCDENLNIVDTFSSFVRLQVGKKISSIVSELTTIRDENLNNALQFMQVVSRFKKWAGDCLILTWGTSDILTLIENCRYFSGDGKIPFLTKYMDLQHYCQERMEISGNEQLGLGKAAELLGVDTSLVKHHRALGDSLISLEVFRRIAESVEVCGFVQDATKEEFYRRMTFRTAIICDMAHPLVSKKSLMFACDKCGGETKRLTKWTLRNKKFISEFKCVNCGHKFAGRVQLKEKYDGLVVSKKYIPLPIIQKPRPAMPDIVGAMDLDIISGVGLLKFPKLKEIEFIKHCFSTRIGGVSKNEFASINLGFGRGDSDENVFENYNIITNALDINKDSLVAGAQDHHLGIRRVTVENAGTGIYKPKDMESIDGLCTNESGVTLVIYAADCVPLYYIDVENKAIGLAHAGWRGTVSGMAKEMLLKMQAEFGSKPENLIVAIGPSISKESFEVDPPCAQEFLKLPESDKFVTDDKNGKFHVDLWECNISYLKSVGVKKDNIHVGGVCSVKNSDLVFSHRVTRGQRGSNAAFLAIKEYE